MKEGKYYHWKIFPSSITLLKSSLIFVTLKCRNAGSMLVADGNIQFCTLYIMMKEQTSFEASSQTCPELAQLEARKKLF